MTKPTCDVMRHTLRIIDWLRQRGLYVFVEPKTYQDIMKSRCMDRWEPESKPEVLHKPSEVSDFYSGLRPEDRSDNSRATPIPSPIGARAPIQWEPGTPEPSPKFGDSVGGELPRLGRLLTWAEDGSQRTLNEAGGPGRGERHPARRRC